MSDLPPATPATGVVPGLVTAPPATVRTSGDRCPGALRLHPADDGGLARLRLPGGLLTADQADGLADAATRFGDGHLHLTARGNAEIRGVADADGLADALADLGLLPSTTHERVRNVLASPLGDLADAVRALDAAITGSPRLADLSGRFLFGLDDGRGDVLALGPDVGACFLTPGTAHLVFAGRPTGLLVDSSDLPRACAVAAEAFLDDCDRRGVRVWRTRELGAYVQATVESMAAAVAEAVPTRPHSAGLPGDSTGGQGPEPGLHPGGVVSALLPLGVAPAATWRALARAARAGDGLVRTTPWRGVVVAGLPEGGRDESGRDGDDHPVTARDALLLLTAAGLVTRADDPWVGVGACTGRPGCAKARADVRSDAARYVARERRRVDADAITEPREVLPLYVSGCDRRCGHPTGRHVEVVATDSGYMTGFAGGGLDTDTTATGRDARTDGGAAALRTHVNGLRRTT